jgi:hypothetical protein
MKCPYENIECIHVDTTSMDKTIECKDCKYYPNPKQFLINTDPRGNPDSLFRLLGNILRPTGEWIGLVEPQ